MENSNQTKAHLSTLTRTNRSCKEPPAGPQVLSWSLPLSKEAGHRLRSPSCPEPRWERARWATLGEERRGRLLSSGRSSLEQRSSNWASRGISWELLLYQHLDPPQSLRGLGLKCRQGLGVLLGPEVITMDNKAQQPLPAAGPAQSPHLCLCLCLSISL